MPPRKQRRPALLPFLLCLLAGVAGGVQAAPPPYTAAADRFPARLEWLRGRLGIDRDRLPVPRCRELETSLAEFQPRFFAILEARSRLGESEASHYVVPPPPRPDLGHASNRLTLAVG